MKVLYLTLHKKWFDMIAGCEKTEEYRDRKPYWIKRLRGKRFDVIHFRNGYRPTSRIMMVECLGIEENGGEFVIKLGEILK